VKNKCGGGPCKSDVPNPIKYKLPYVPSGRDLETNSINLDVKHGNFTEKDMHSLYAF